MKYYVFILLSCIAFFSCKQKDEKKTNIAATATINPLLDRYYEERLQLFPIEATFIGDSRYNDKLYIDFTDEYRNTLKSFFKKYLDSVNTYKRDQLNKQDQISYDIFKWEVQTNLEGLSFNDNYIPSNQFYALPLFLGQLGSGASAQPFKTVKDYDDWAKRVSVLSAWTDSAIVYFRKGIEKGIVLPKSIVVKMIPQMKSLVATDPTKSLFYTPISKLPADFSADDKKRLTDDYKKLISTQISTSYKKLADFLEKEYMPKARTTSGIGSLPGGEKLYAFLVKQQTTTNKTPEEIYQTGLSEVARIKSLMDSIKNSTGFKETLPEFFNYMKTDKRFMPFKKPEEVLAAFEAIHQRMLPNLKKMFNHTPKTPFEIRQTEAFRAASASAEYNPGSPDGSRPGIFYVPILDATKFNTTSGMESLFLHEAIPGHHYQISLQQEDTSLPKFRRFGGNNAYAEGWALYCESLGKELGLYTDPYQYMGALGDEMHRAIRLVVDVAIHLKGMTREEAIKYMMDNEAISKEGATAEIERYMVIPGQALGYKIGALKIRELRNRAEKKLGTKFNLASFHDEILKDGAMPLDVLDKKVEAWENGVK